MSDPVNPIVVSTAQGVGRLIDVLFDEVRSDLVVVVSTSTKATEPYLDVDWLGEELQGIARIFVLTSWVANEFTNRLGNPRISVFGGAGRIYPPGNSWKNDPYKAPLFFCYPGQGRSISERIVDGARIRSYRPGSAVVPKANPTDVVTTAEVIGCPTESQIFVRTEDGLTCKMLAVHLYPGVEANRLVQNGQRLRGRERFGNLMGEFFPDKLDDDPVGRAREQFADGAVTWALVDRVSASHATVMLHPNVGAELLPATDDLTLLLSEGDIVPVEVIWDENRVLAGLSQPADADPAMSLLPGGPPWLTPDELDTAVSTASQEPQEPAPGVSVPQLDEDEANATIALVSDMLRQQDEELVRLRDEVRALKRVRRESNGSFRPRVYSDDDEQFRFEVRLSYLTRVPESEREQFPLPSLYELGKDFLVTLGEQVLSGRISRDKVVDVCADVLCGKAAMMTSRLPKPWLVSKHGAQESRPDGALAWRVRLQVNANSARRMKYWVHRDRTVELDSVGVHDYGL